MGTEKWFYSREALAAVAARGLTIVEDHCEEIARNKNGEYGMGKMHDEDEEGLPREVYVGTLFEHAPDFAVWYSMGAPWVRHGNAHYCMRYLKNGTGRLKTPANLTLQRQLNYWLMH